MSFILDTNIISELRKPEPAPELLDWYSRVDEESLLISVLTIGEIQMGIKQLDDGKRKQELEIWLETIKDNYKSHLIPVSADVAEKWGELSASCRKAGKTLPVIDGLIAATASVTGSILVTRNTSDFEGTGIRLMNPWLSGD